MMHDAQVLIYVIKLIIYLACSAIIALISLLRSLALRVVGQL